jgi:hypothetical protein
MATQFTLNGTQYATASRTKLRKSWAARLGLMTASLGSVLYAGPEAQAAVIKVTGSAVTLSIDDGNGARAFWDVDGDSVNDFRLENSSNAMLFASNGLRGRGLVETSLVAGNVQLLDIGFQVGPTLPASAGWGPGVAVRAIMSSAGPIGEAWEKEFQQGDNFFGFRFQKGADPASLNYGYGIVNFNSSTRTVSITQWAYESSPNTPLTVESFDPAAVPGPIGLAGLAAGAAWTRKLRRRIRQSADVV